MRPRLTLVALAVVIAFVLAARRGPRAPPSARGAPGAFVSGSVRRADYTASAACARCHGDVAAA